MLTTLTMMKFDKLVVLMVLTIANHVKFVGEHHIL
jgi:hypothetical protein